MGGGGGVDFPEKKSGPIFSRRKNPGQGKFYCTICIISKRKTGPICE